PSAERGPQTGDRRTVSNPGLVFQVADPQAAHRLDDEIVEFVGVGAAAGKCDALAPIHHASPRILFHERLATSLLDEAADLFERLLPPDVFPAIGAGPANLRLEKTAIVQDVLLKR